jgi:Asp-tRNA(Asn)/Glu-tRNA(Gln) amidotransferase A subunit family amidase
MAVRDARARAGVTLGRLDGVIIGIKNLFDVAGEPTRAGSKVLAKAPPADADTPVVRRLRAAGGVIIAKTKRRYHRQDQYERVRLLRDRSQPTLRHTRQSG